MNIDMWLRPEFMIVWVMHVVDLLASKVKKQKVEGEREKKNNMGLHNYGWDFSILYLI